MFLIIVSFYTAAFSLCYLHDLGDRQLQQQLHSFCITSGLFVYVLIVFNVFNVLSGYSRLA